MPDFPLLPLPRLETASASRARGAGGPPAQSRLGSASLPAMNTVFPNERTALAMGRWRGAIAPALVVVGRADPPVYRPVANRPPAPERAEPGLSSARTGDGA